jgi:pyruvate formate lyase activating enzyme
VTVDEVLARVRRDAPFYRRSGGGVTLSGGEPLAQWRFARALARACYEENLSVALETTGCASWEVFAAALEFVDLVLYDLKQIDDTAHRAATGVGSALPLANLRRLAASGVPFVLRLPLVPGHSLDAAHLRGAGVLAAELGARGVHLMPFHQLAREKYRRLGRPYALADLPGLGETPAGREEIERARRIVEESGIPVAVGG